MNVGFKRRSKRCCPPIPHRRFRSDLTSTKALQMSRLLGVAKQKVRKKAENVFDRLRSSRRDERPASPTSSQQSQHSVGLRPEDISAPSESTGSEATSQAAVVSTSVTTSSSNWAEHSATDTLSLPSAPALSTTPAYARPPSPRTVLATTGSAVKGLLAAARDGSDLFLPLKAALVGVVALWDVWDVRHSIMNCFLYLN